jgi:hypothetical protein
MGRHVFIWGRWLKTGEITYHPIYDALSVSSPEILLAGWTWVVPKNVVAFILNLPTFLGYFFVAFVFGWIGSLLRSLPTYND